MVVISITWMGFGIYLTMEECKFACEKRRRKRLTSRILDASDVFGQRGS